MTQRVTDEQIEAIRNCTAPSDKVSRDLCRDLLDARAALAEREADLEATRAVNAALVRESNDLRAEVERLRGALRGVVGEPRNMPGPPYPPTYTIRVESRALHYADAILSAPAPPEPSACTCQGLIVGPNVVHASAPGQCRVLASAPPPPEPTSLDSPNFVPDATKAFVAGGMKRVNRHTPPPEPACECGCHGFVYKSGPRDCICCPDGGKAIRDCQGPKGGE